MTRSGCASSLSFNKLQLFKTALKKGESRFGKWKESTNHHVLSLLWTRKFIFPSIQKLNIFQCDFMSLSVSICWWTKYDTRCSEIPNRWFFRAAPRGERFCHLIPEPNKITVQKILSLSNDLFYLPLFTAPFVFTEKNSISVLLLKRSRLIM